VASTSFPSTFGHNEEASILLRGGSALFKAIP
jgi:hypothetical protein